MSLDRLTALDQVMLGASQTWPQDIGALVLLDGSDLLDSTGRFRIETARVAIQSRLDLVPRFRQLIHRPRWGLGPPLWVDAPKVDITHHVRELPLEPPAGEAELLLAVEHLQRLRLDPTCPLWEMWFLTGLPERQIGLFVKIHHAVADGMASMMTMVAFLDRAADAPAASAREWAPGRWPSTLELLADNLRRYATGLANAFSMLVRPRATLRQVMRAWPATRELLAEEPGPETSLDRVVGPDRKLALIRMTVDPVRGAARAHDATLNDLLLAVTAGGLRALLRSRGEPVTDLVLPIYVPVSLRRRLRGPQQGNLIGQMVVPLSVGIADPGERLRQIAAETTTRKARPRPSLGILMHGRLARRLMLKAVLRQRVNLMSACIPGPKRPLFLAGARVLEVFPVLPLIANEALGVGALSYAGTFAIGIAADRDAYPDLDVFVAGVGHDLHALGVPTHVALSRAGAEASGAPLDRDGRPAIDPRFAVRYSTKRVSAAERR